MTRCYHAALVMAVAAAISLAAVGTSQAQRRGSRRGLSALTLLRAEQVQTELKLADDQKTQIKEILEKARSDSRALFEGLTREERQQQRPQLREKSGKIRDQARAKVDKILGEPQRKRLDEITLQISGASALRDDKVAKQVGLSDEQKKEVAAIQKARSEKSRELFRAVRDGSIERDQVREKFRAIGKETNEKILGLLSAEQKEKFEKMKGEKFDVDRSKLFGRRRRSNS